MNKEHFKVITVLLAAAFLIAAALIIAPRGSPPQVDWQTVARVVHKSSATTTEPVVILPSAPTALILAPLTAPEVTVTQKDLAGETTPKYTETIPELAKITNYKKMAAAYKLRLTSAEENFLEEHKFVLVPMAKTALAFPDNANFDEMLNAFDYTGGAPGASERVPENAKLVTPDIVLHAYHRFFENSLEDLEQGYLYDQLDLFLNGYTENLRRGVNWHDTSAPILAAHYDRLLGQALVAKVLLENHVVGELSSDSADVEYDKNVDSLDNAMSLLAANSGSILHPQILSPQTMTEVKEELRRIYESDNVYRSELFGEYNSQVKGDYTQYTPRSHYTKNSKLRAYFRAMMYLGRNTYFFKNDAGVTDAVLAAIAYNTPSRSTGVIPREPWKNIMELTGFYAGQSDDVTYNEWADYITKTLGVSTINSEMAVDPKVIAKLAANLKNLRLPKILSDIIVDPNIAEKNKNDLLRATLGLRLFGQRFTFDAWVLNQLTSGAEDPTHPLPSMPTALFIPAAFGSARAVDFSHKYLIDILGWSDDNASYFNSKLAGITKTLASVTIKDWFGSLGTAWLYVLESLTKVFGAGYPQYMQDAAFADKSLITWLGSYTELKHDTVLYAKQSYAEAGAGGGEDKPDKPLVKGFVEPNIIFWKKLEALVDYHRALYEKYGLNDKSSAGFMLDEFKTALTLYRTIAEKELSGVPVSPAEYEQLRTTALSFMAAPIGYGNADPTVETRKTALVTDVHTDASGGQILYEGVGQPYLMIALVGNENSPRAVLGPVFNHYEFTGPLAKRLTDEVWKKDVYTAPQNLPARNFWYDGLIVK